VKDDNEKEFFNKFQQGIPTEEQNVDGPNYVHIPSEYVPPDLTPQQITAFNFDKSSILEEFIFPQYGSENDLLGELQYSFILFLILYSYESFEHWKKILQLLCQVDESIEKRKNFFIQFIKVFHHQIEEVPNDFFIDIISGGNNFLLFILKSFFEIAEGHEHLKDLRLEVSKFKSFIEGRFNMSFSISEIPDNNEIDDEDNPTLVLEEDLLNNLNLTPEELKKILENSE